MIGHISDILFDLLDYFLSKKECRSTKNKNEVKRDSKHASE